MAEVEEALPTASDDAAARDATIATPQLSALRRAKDKIAAHVSTMSSLLEDHKDDVHVEFADASLRTLQALLHGRCVPSVEIARLHAINHDYPRDDKPGTQALNLLGRALRSMAIARNEHYTVGDGFEPDEYGLPVITVKPPKYFGFESDENISPGGTHSLEELHDPIDTYPLWSEGTAPIVDPGDIWCTWGELRGVTGHVDVSRLPPIQGRREETNQKTKEQPAKKKIYSANSVAPPFEYKCDEEGNVMVKSEMMGDDEFFDHQIQMRELGGRYEDIARTGLYEERFIMKHIKGRGAKTGKNYECDECGEICPNQHKFAAHKKYVHPKNPAMRAATAASKAGRARNSDAAAEVINPEREKRERRAPLTRDTIINDSTTSSPLPTSIKIYTCPICTENIDSQYKFACHMRYKHPKGSEHESMVGRRASVTKVQNAPPSVSLPSPLVSKITSSSTSTSTENEEKKEMNESQKMFNCPTCNRSFTSAAQMGGHKSHCKRDRPLPSLPSPSIPSSSKMTSSIKKEETPKSYSCSVCARPFDNFNALAGHTRHCLRANGMDPSPRAMLRREQIAAKTAFATRVAKKEPLPMSPLAASPLTTVGKEKKVQGKKERKVANPMSRKRVAATFIKEEEEEEEEEEEKPHPSELMSTASAAETPTTRGKVNSHLSTVGTRSSSRSRLLPGTSSSLSTSSISTASSAKRGRTVATPTPYREVKEEPIDEDEETERKNKSAKRAKKTKKTIE